ncbi:MAG: peptidylprolyl isomerase [Sphingomonadales bacterium]|nr:MAG: peptidylprolyl isomerase [Sphingomonadales bacterium]
MKHLLLTAVAAASFVFPAFAPASADEPTPILSPGEIAAAAPASDWVAIASSDLLVMDLAPDARGKPRRIVIQLIPAPFSQGWIGNIRKLAAAHWWDGMSVNRVQDNYVAQWGDANGEDAAMAKPLPSGLSTPMESDYTVQARALVMPMIEVMYRSKERLKQLEQAQRKSGPPTIYAPDMRKKVDPYSDFQGFVAGWPVAGSNGVWPVHCYGMVGVGRNMSPDTGSGAELYAVIGHAPRHLDRNIAVVGRVISGIEHLSSLPRGTGALGFYEDAAERVGIASIRVATELPAAEQPRFEYLSTESDSFTRYADARANRRDPFFIKPAGGADICNIPVPVRPVATK